MSESPSPSESLNPDETLNTHANPVSASTRLEGLSTMAQGAAFALAGVLGLWLSFRFGNGAKAILGAGPLIGGGMIGFGAVQMLLGDRIPFLRWVAAVVSGFVILGATIVLLETTLGVTLG